MSNLKDKRVCRFCNELNEVISEQKDIVVTIHGVEITYQSTKLNDCNKCGASLETIEDIQKNLDIAKESHEKALGYTSLMLKELREKACKSKADISKELGINLTTIVKIEEGKFAPSPSYVSYIKSL